MKEVQARDDTSVRVMAKKSHPSTCSEVARVEKRETWQCGMYSS
jgi:hypothetical protein